MPTFKQETCEPPIYFQTKHVLSKNEGKVHNGPILGMSISNDATRIATCSSDYSMRVFKLPFDKWKGEGCTFLGHSNIVTSVRWSHDDKLLLTSSMDGSSCLWRYGKSDPILQLKEVVGNVGSTPRPESGAKPTIVKKVQAKPSATVQAIYRGDVRNAQFYYKDKFIVLANNNSLLIYKYFLPKFDESEILKK